MAPRQPGGRIGWSEEIDPQRGAAMVAQGVLLFRFQPEERSGDDGSGKLSAISGLARTDRVKRECARWGAGLDR